MKIPLEFFKFASYANMNIHLFECREANFELEIIDYDSAISLAFSYIKNPEAINPFRIIFSQFDFKHSHAWFEIFLRGGAISSSDLQLMSDYEKILKLECLRSSDLLLDEEMRLFKDALFNAIFRPFHFQQIIDSCRDINKEAFLRKMCNYISGLTHSAFAQLKHGLGKLSIYELSSSTFELTKAILFSEPSLQIMIMMHCDVYQDRKHIKSYTKKVLKN